MRHLQEGSRKGDRRFREKKQTAAGALRAAAAPRRPTYRPSRLCLPAELSLPFELLPPALDAAQHEGDVHRRRRAVGLLCLHRRRGRHHMRPPQERSRLRHSVQLDRARDPAVVPKVAPRVHRRRGRVEAVVCERAAFMRRLRELARRARGDAPAACGAVLCGRASGMRQRGEGGVSGG